MKFLRFTQNSKRSERPKRSINATLTSVCRTQRGVTLLELVVSVIVAMVILSGSLGLIVTQRRQYLNQQAKTDTNQTLQTAMDMVGIDVRQVGEQIESSGLGLPVVRLLDGPAGAPDELVLQRKLLAKELNVCETVAGNPTSILVAQNTGGNCLFSDADNNTVPDDVQEWQDYRCNQDKVAGCAIPTPNCQQVGGNSTECSWAYLYDPMAGTGEFLLYQGESGNSTAYRIQVNAQPPGLTHTYLYNATAPAASLPKLYILEERRYSLSAANPNNTFCNGTSGDRTLRLSSVDSQSNTATNPYDLVNHLCDFQVTGYQITNPAAQAAAVTQFNTNLVAGRWTNWQSLQAIEVQLSAPFRPPDVTTIQTLSSKFYPRNSLSRP